MKRLITLALSVLLCVVMMSVASATVTQDDIAFYLRFDSQDAIDHYVYGKNVNVSFDAEHASMLIVPKQSGENISYNDNNVTVFLEGDGFSLADYPWVRFTYYYPDLNSKGESNHATPYLGYLYLNVNTGGGLAEVNMGDVTFDKYTRYVANLSGYTGKLTKNVGDIRLDVPNDIGKGEPSPEIYIYDIGFFKTREAAYSYNYVQTSYVQNFMLPDAYKMFTEVSEGTMSYNAEDQATVFTHAAVASGADARINYGELDARYMISTQNLPWISFYTKTNKPEYACWFLGNGLFSGTSDWLSTSGTSSLQNTVADEFQLLHRNLLADTAPANHYDECEAHLQFAMDPINDSGAKDGTEWRSWKYIAFYATEEEASKESQVAPLDVKGELSETAGKAKLTGLTDAMEYRLPTDEEWTKAEGETAEVECGKTYYVRYAADDTHNPGFIAEVGTPVYWDLKINAVKDSQGNTLEGASIEPSDMTHYSITLPYGTDVTAIQLDYTLTTGASESYLNNAVNGLKYEIYRTPHLTLDSMHNTDNNNNTPPEVLGLFDVSDYIGAPMTLYAYSLQTINEEIEITFDVAPRGDDSAAAQQLADSLMTVLKDKINLTILREKTTDAEIKEVLEGILDADRLASVYRGVSAQVNIEGYKAPVKGTLEAPDGTDGSFSYTVSVNLGSAQAQSASESVTIPAPKYRVVLIFNDQEMANRVVVSDPKLKRAPGDHPIVTTQDGKSFMRMEYDQAGKGGSYFVLTYANAQQVKSGDYEYIINCEDYPYMAFSYRSDVGLPTSTNQVYFETSYYVENNTYSETTVPVSGYYKGYKYYQNAAYWQMPQSVYPSKTNFENVVVDTRSNDIITNGPTVQDLYGHPYYYGAGLQYPWKGNLTVLRMSISMLNEVPAGSYYDIEYIAFFSTREEAEAFTGLPARPITEGEKTTIDTAIGEVDGTQGGTEEALKLYIAEKLKEDLGDQGEYYSEITVNTQSYTSFDIAAQTDGSYTYTISVKKGDKLGDKDLYTSKQLTVTVKCPPANASSAAHALENTAYSATGIRFESGAKAYVQAMVDDVMASYEGYSAEISTVSYTAASSSADGSYKFTVNVTGSDSATTKELTLTIKYVDAPYIINFGSPIVVGQTGFVYNNSGQKATASKAFVAEEGHLSGGYTEYIREDSSATGAPSTEFNISVYPGNATYPIYPAIPDLAKYQYILYKYKAPGHTSNQVYYYTDVNTGNPRLDITPSASVDDWNYHLYKVSDVIKVGQWKGKVNQLRFDFYRSSAGARGDLCLEFIGLFETLEQAQTFMIAPELDSEDTVEQLTEEYSAQLEQLKSDKLYIISGVDDAAQAVKDYVAKLSADAYPLDIKTEGSNVTFKVMFSKTPVNGNYVLSDTVTAELVTITGETKVTEQRAKGELRFKTVLNKDWMDKVADEGTEVTYGTYVVPTKILAGATLDEKAVANADLLVADVKGEKIYEDAESTLTYTAVVTGIPDKYLDTGITARAYVKFTHNGKECTVLLSDILESSFNAAPAAG